MGAGDLMNSPNIDRESERLSFAYLFEAKGIQRYIFDSGRLRALIGASDLVSDLTRSRKENGAADFIDKVLAALDITTAKDGRQPGELSFSRRSGGAFLAHADDAETLCRLRSLWRLTVGLQCPGLEISDIAPISESSDKGAIVSAYGAVSSRRTNSAAELPPTGHPLCAFNPQTGRLATAVFSYADETAYSDLVTTPQILRAEQLTGAIDAVAARFLGENRTSNGLKYVFPRNMEPVEDTPTNPAFPFDGDSQRIAVVHADVSGLGAVFREISAAAETTGQVLEVANAIEVAIERAAQIAVKEVLLAPGVPEERLKDGIAVVPARPVLLGGDDITILVRADLSIAFARRLLEEIKNQTSAAFADLRSTSAALAAVLPDFLSACAGLAIVKAGQPFSMASSMAESLCGYAKSAAKDRRKSCFPSLLAFHNAQSTVAEDYVHETLPRERTGMKLDSTKFGDGSGRTLYLTANPLLVCAGAEPSQVARLDALLRLAETLLIEPRGLGKLVELRDLFASDIEMASTVWLRWREVLESRNELALQQIDAALSDLGIQKPATCLPIARGDRAFCPLPDAMELIDLGCVLPRPIETEVR